jgi:hypothetical protein
MVVQALVSALIIALRLLCWCVLYCSCLQQPGETVRSQVLESLGCWLKLSGGSHLPPGLAESPLVQAALEGLRVEGTFHAAVDAVSFCLGWGLPAAVTATQRS